MSNRCTLHDPQFLGVIDQLHNDSKKDAFGLLKIGFKGASDRILGRTPSVEELASRFRNLYIPLSRKQGKFVYLLARSIEAKRIVEFGTSFGISTLYLAAAIKDNGGGIVIGSEIDPTKRQKALENIDEAGLLDFVDVRGGDARQSLADPGGTIDMLLLDGWKDLYTEITELLAPNLRKGAIIVADNIYSFHLSMRPFLAYLRNRSSGFESLTLSLSDGTEFGVKLDESSS